MRGSISRIILVEGDANDTKFRLEEGKEIGVVRSIKFFERYLENPRFACGYLGLLGLTRITWYNSEQEVLTMSNGQTAKAARKRKSILKGFDGLKMSCGLEI